MRVALAVALLLVSLANVAYADEYTVDNGPSKGVIMEGDKHCVGETHQDGHHLTIKTWIAYDVGQMNTNPQREQAWQEGECRYEVDTQATFWYQRRGLTYDASQTTYHTTTAR